jgi:plastocyanin
MDPNVALTAARRSEIPSGISALVGCGAPTERGVRMRKLAVLASALIVAALALAACGGDDDNDTTAAGTTQTTQAAGGGGGGGETLKVTADPNGDLAYEQKSLSATAGQATIDFDNPSSTGHDVTIEDESGNEVAATDVVTDDTATATADLKAGTYTFFCSVDEHRQAGMEGTLTVK